MNKLKDNILICFNNFYVVENLQDVIKKLSNSYSITLIFTNKNLKLNNKELDNFKKKLNLQKMIVLEFYDDEKKSKLKFIQSLFKVKKTLNNNDFKGCIIDNNLPIWLKVITDYFKKKQKKIIGFKHDSLSLDTLKVREFLLNGDVNNILSTSHKLRFISGKAKKNENKKKFSVKKKLFNLYNLFFERYLIPFLIFRRTFPFTQQDLATGFDDKTIDNVICFFYTGYIFWGSYYGFDKTFYVSFDKRCNCSKDEKKKLLFVASLLWENNENLLDIQINRIVKFTTKILRENKSINQLDFKFHPAETQKNVILIKKKIEKLSLPIKLNYIGNLSLIDKSCDYSVAFGMVSSALFYVANSCNACKVFCLKSISVHYYKEYYLKLFNENITFYDDINDSQENLEKLYSEMLFDKSIKKNDIYSTIKNILN